MTKRFFYSWTDDVTGGFHDSDDPGYLEVVSCNDNSALCRKYPLLMKN